MTQPQKAPITSLRDPQEWIDAAKTFMPKGYAVERYGVMKGDKIITTTPVVVEAIFVDPDTEAEYWRLAWLAKWIGGQLRVRRHVALKSDLLGRPGGIRSLADHGLDLGLDNAKAVARYLQLLAARDLPVLPCRSQMGWDAGYDNFLWGEFCLTGDDMIGNDPTGSLEPGAIYLDPAAGKVYTDGLEAKGTLEEWLKAAAIVGFYPRVALALYAAAAPLLLRILGAGNFAVQWAGPGSTGKSTCVALAASCWGNPDLTAPRAAVFPSSSSESFLARGAELLRDLPVCIDLDGSGNARLTTQKIHRIVNGRSEHRSWTTVAIASGADTLSDDGADDAVRARLLCLWGPPFGRHNKETAKDVAEIKAILAGNYGVFGPELVRRLLRAKANGAFMAWREAYLKTCQDFSQKAAQHGGIASHTAEHLATVAMVARIVHALFPEFEWDHAPTLRDLWTWLQLSTVRSSRSSAALDLLKEFQAKNQDRIVGLRLAKLPPPRDGWIGTIDDDGRVWTVMGIVNDLLVDAGLKPMEICREWLQTGALVPTLGRWWRVIRVGSQHCKCMALDDRFDFQHARREFGSIRQQCLAKEA
jgi:hypothetical protein